MSFSWGASNSASLSTSGVQGKSTPVTRSNISNNRTAGSTGDAASAEVMSGGVRVATGDVDGDGFADMISHPVSVMLSDATVSPTGDRQVTILQGVVVTAQCSPSGKTKGGWDLKENTK
jgi:hypothetical protein